MHEIGISNIAWDVSLDAEVARCLLQNGVNTIDVAPGKYFQDLSSTKTYQIKSLRDWWEERGFHFGGMQSLFYGTKGLNIFGGLKSQEVMLEHLRHLSRIGAELGATKLVFGSPKNRDCSGYGEEETLEIALNFFKQLGKIAAEEGVVVCIEANPSCYGANFLTTTLSVYEFVESLNLSSIKMQLDTGTMFINKETPDLIPLIKGRIGHIHISEPCLTPLGHEDHQLLGESLKSIDLPRTIEILTNDGNLNEILYSVGIAQKYYGAR